MMMIIIIMTMMVKMMMMMILLVAPGGDPQGRLGRGGVKRVQAGVLAFLAAFSLVT